MNRTIGRIKGKSLQELANRYALKLSAAEIMED